MRPFPRALLLAALAAWVMAPGGARAYEGEHYAWTYYLALHVGFTERQAFQIASGAYAIDWHPNTGPMPDGHWGNVEGAAASTQPRLRAMWSKFHAFGVHEVLRRIHDRLGVMQRFEVYGGLDDKFRPEIVAAKEAQERRLWEDGLKAGNPGPFIHFRQDRWSHNGWYDLFGHGAASHFPDYLSNDPNAAWQMTQTTVDELTRFRAAWCAATPRPKSCDRQVGEVDLARIRIVFDRLVAANPLPVDVKDRFGLLYSLKRFSLSFNYNGEAKALHARGVDELPWAARFLGNVARAATGITLRLWQSNADAGVTDWLLDMPGPNLERTLDVVRLAIDEDKARGAGFVDFTGGGELAAHVAERSANGVHRDELPDHWIDYQYDSEGRIAADPDRYAVEDPVVVAGGASATFERPAGSDRVTVKLSVPLSLAGITDLGFLDELPAVAEASLTGVATPVKVVKRSTLGRKRKTLNLEAQVPAAEFNSVTSKWHVKVAAYGLRPQEFEFAFTAPFRQLIGYGLVTSSCLGDAAALANQMRAGDTAKETEVYYGPDGPPSVDEFRAVRLKVMIWVTEGAEVQGSVQFCYPAYFFRAPLADDGTFDLTVEQAFPVFKVGPMTLRGTATGPDPSTGHYRFSGGGVFTAPNTLCRGTDEKAEKRYGKRDADCAFEWKASTDCSEVPAGTLVHQDCLRANGD
ncbi:MAG: hypothetical protein H6907_17290 [Hyphomicrobiales bacterium]|nr:hypothetical protein [Hyphomicrobiales bacterium]